MPPLPPRPIDATLSVTKAARLLGVHPNTVRAWSDAGRLRYYRINPRGDRRYRMGDLQRFLAAAAAGAPGESPTHPPIPAGQPAPSRRQVGDLLRFPLPAPVGAVPDDPPAGDPEPGEPGDPERIRDAEVLGDIAVLAARGLGRDRMSLDELLAAAARTVRDGLGLALVAIWESDGQALTPRAAAGSGASRLFPIPVGVGVVGRALETPLPRVVEETRPARAVIDGLGPELAAPIEAGGRPWGALLLAGAPTTQARELAWAAARAIGALVTLARTAEQVGQQTHRAEALRRLASDLGSRLDLDQIVSAAVEHALVLFEADRAAIALRRPDGTFVPASARGLSTAWQGVAAAAPPGSLPAAALSDRLPRHAVDYRDDPRATAIRAAIVQEGFDTLCVAPLFVGNEILGLLSVIHDRPHPWSDEELDALAAFGTQASVAIRTAQNYTQMARWAAQLQSIQQLGARLNRLTSVREIGMAIATELRQLIDYHNVRVYRIQGEELVPVAMQGQVGVYVDETPEQLKVRLGQGITGWVAVHKLPQSLPDAAKDPRANTIPGTEDDLDESMLLAPMLFEDQVLGVLVLSKLGLGQFSDDDLRLLVIYASFAAQAMANADASERVREQTQAMERQVRGQRELLHITESILTTLDPRAVLDQIADRLGALIGYDNISIEVYDRGTHMLRPLTARGANADDYLQPWEVGETGVATWVIEHNEPVLITDQFDDPRVRPFDSTGPVHGGLVVVPLRGREGVTGVLTVERLGVGNTFTDDEFELVKLFAAQVSIALQNAEIHHAVEIRARTDGLTGLLNHVTFREWLSAYVARGERFSLVMLDLDAFKAVNDALGHQAGDRFLTEIGAAIVAAGRDSDHVFRYGGDEFAIILPGAEAAAARAVAERVRSAIAAIGASGTRWHAGGTAVSASFGVATFPDDGATAETILLAADRACFVAKRAGSGRIASADEGLALAAEFSLQEPTPVDSPTAPAA